MEDLKKLLSLQKDYPFIVSIDPGGTENLNENI